MSIIKSKVTSLFQPAYNNAYLNIISNNTNNVNFHYVFDLYVQSAVTQTVMVADFAGRYTLLPRWPQGNCIYSPNGVIESYLSYDKTQNITGGTISSGCCRQVTVNMGEQSGSTIFTAVTNYVGYVLNSAAQYEDLPDWNYNNEWMNFRMETNYTDTFGGQFLTNQPASVYIRNNERASLSFLNYSNLVSGNTASYFKIEVVQISGGSMFYTVINRAMNTGITINANWLVNHFGSGIWNINHIPQADIASGAQPIINANTDSKYIISIYDQTQTQQVSRSQTYQIDRRCTKFTPIRFMFLNLLGQFDYFTAILMSREITSIDKKTYEKNLAYDYSIGDRGTTVTNVEAKKSVTVATDWVTDAESTWLQEFFLSKEVYELQMDGTILPIKIDNSSVEKKKMINDKLINYEFNYTYAFPIAVQRA